MAAAPAAGRLLLKTGESANANLQDAKSSSADDRVEPRARPKESNDRPSGSFPVQSSNNLNEWSNLSSDFK